MKKILKRLLFSTTGYWIGENQPFPSCPFCGTRLVMKGQKWLGVMVWQRGNCPNFECRWNDGIPNIDIIRAQNRAMRGDDD